MQGGPGMSREQSRAPEPLEPPPSPKPPPSDSPGTPQPSAPDSETPAPAPTPGAPASGPGGAAEVPAYAQHSNPAQAGPATPLPSAGHPQGPHGGGHRPRRRKGKAKNSGVSTSMQALLGLLALSGLLTVVVAAIAVLLIQRRRNGMRGMAVRGDSVVFAVRPHRRQSAIAVQTTNSR